VRVLLEEFLLFLEWTPPPPPPGSEPSEARAGAMCGVAFGISFSLIAGTTPGKHRSYSSDAKDLTYLFGCINKLIYY